MNFLIIVCCLVVFNTIMVLLMNKEVSTTTMCRYCTVKAAVYSFALLDIETVAETKTDNDTDKHRTQWESVLMSRCAV